MSTTGNVNFNVVNDAFVPAAPALGVVYFEGVTPRGPVNDPKDVITSPKLARLIFGNIVANNDFPLLCQRALQKGAILRINRVVGAGAATGVSGNATQTIASSPVTLFHFVPLGPGADYNNVKINITDATNKNANYFNVVITSTTDPLISEVYENLTIVGHPTAAAATFLKKIADNSNIVAPAYVDLSAQSVQLRPVNATLSITGGVDGAAPIITDYIGDVAAGTGFYAFDPYDEAYAIACPDVSESDLTGISTGGEAYARGRKDLRYYQHLDNTNVTAAALIAEKPAIDSNFIIFTAGGLDITHPLTGSQVSISELGDVLGNMAYIHEVTKKPWNAFFGPDFGVLDDCLGVTNNFGSRAKFNDLDLLAQHRINMVIKRGGLTMLWDDYTSQTDPSPENFACLENLLIYLERILRTPLEKKLGQPTDFQLLKDIYYTIEPIIREVVDGRGISDWTWEGDQFATAYADLQVNVPADMQQGKIKANLRIVTIAPLKEISVSIILTKAGVTFSQS